MEDGPLNMYQCAICSQYQMLRDLDMINPDIEIYLCKIGKGCMEGKKYQIKNIKAPYPSLKVFEVDDEL